MTSPGEPRSLNSPGGQNVTGVCAVVTFLPVPRDDPDGLPAPATGELCFQFVQLLREPVDHVLDVLQGDLSALQASRSDRVLLDVFLQDLRFFPDVVVQPGARELDLPLYCLSCSDG